MVDKYEKQYDEMHNDLILAVKAKQRKDVLIHKLRRKKVVLHHMNVCRRKIETLTQKQYALEQLNITKMQIDAIKDTVKVFKIFNKNYSIEKIEDLQDQLEEFSSQIMEVDSCLNEATPLIEIDDSELADELDEMESLMFPSVPTNVPIMKNNEDHDPLLPNTNLVN
tara:strand:- start:3371 stop:3871 length:501 start_codon:yes stop_codon:yes gene_type:complete